MARSSVTAVLRQSLALYRRCEEQSHMISVLQDAPFIQEHSLYNNYDIL